MIIRAEGGLKLTHNLSWCCGHSLVQEPEFLIRESKLAL